MKKNLFFLLKQFTNSDITNIIMKVIFKGNNSFKNTNVKGFKVNTLKELEMPKYVKCPRCDLNYILEGEDYCDVCKAELKIGPQLMYADDEDKLEEKLCPKCKQVYIPIDEDMCDNCREMNSYDDIEPETDDENDEKWRDFLDEDEKEEISNSGDEEEVSLSKMVEEEFEEEFADDEEEDEEYDGPDDDDDDFDIEIDESDFEDDEEDENEDEDNGDNDDLF